MDDAECHLLHPVAGGICKHPVERRQTRAGGAEVMKLTAGDLKELGIVEEIVEEPGEFTVDTMPVVCEELRGKILRFLEKYEKMDGEELVEERYRRFRDM